MKATSIGAFEAKTHLSALLERVGRGHVYVITKHGRPLAELRPATVREKRPHFGSDRGRVLVAEDFDQPLPKMRGNTE